MNNKYFLLTLLLSLLLFTSNNYTQQSKLGFLNFTTEDALKEKPVQYRRGIELQAGHQSYEEKYFGKDLNEEKRRLFPLQSTGVWTELNPGVPRVDYVGIDFINPDTGWACGGSGAIIKTINGGADWTISETPINNLLLKIHSYNGQIVIATGYDGIILRSSDGGENFEQVPSGVGSGIDLWGLQMLNDTLGWVCGMNQTLLKTTDSGLTWQMITPGLNQHYWSLKFLNESYGMVVSGNGIVLRTTNGGTNWTQIQAGDTRALYTIDIIDSLHIVAGGGPYGKNVYSSNGGETWIQNANLIYENGVNCIAFINTEIGYAVGEQWAIRKTTNRGVSWFASDPVYGEWQLELLENGIGYDAGNELRIYKTTGGYDNWEKLFFTDNINDVFFTNENKGFIIVSDPAKLYKTMDAGLSWDSIPGAPGGTDLLFLDTLTGFIGSSVIYKTTNGGTTWYIPNGGSDGAGKIFFINETIGWAIRSNKIYKSTDKGENWFVQITLPADNFTSIFFIDTLNGWATSRYIWQTTDGGENWIERTDIPIFLPDDIYFPDLNTGWVGRYSSINNSLFKTTDGGLNWVAIPEVIGARKFYFFPNPIHWLTIGFSRYYITNDYGNSWFEFTDDVTTGLSSFNAPIDNLGYAVGSLGLIIRHEDTTYVPVELILFKVKVCDNEIGLTWATASELNNQGFYIEKSYDKLKWETIGFVKGKGTTTELHHYSFTDESLQNGVYQYRLKQIDFDGSFKYSKIVEVIVGLPTEYSLSQNYPNPFNPNTKIRFTIPSVTLRQAQSDKRVRLVVYDVIGNEIATLVNEEKQPGIYEVEFNGNNLPSGVYFCQLRTENYIRTIKMLLLK